MGAEARRALGRHTACFSVLSLNLSWEPQQGNIEVAAHPHALSGLCCCPTPGAGEAGPLRLAVPPSVSCPPSDLLGGAGRDCSWLGEITQEGRVGFSAGVLCTVAEWHFH